MQLRIGYTILLLRSVKWSAGVKERRHSCRRLFMRVAPHFSGVAHGKNGASRSEVGDRNVAAPCASAAAGFHRPSHTIGITPFCLFACHAPGRV